jgi:tetratricopeptide (TPR) repeat protein
MTDAALRKFVALMLLLVSASLGACTHWHGDLERLANQDDRDFRRDPSKNFKEVDLRTVVANATTFKHVDVRFNAIMNRMGEKAFVPFWTTFESENYISFSVWPGESRLWEAEERNKAHSLLFVRKDNPGLQDLMNAPRFALVRVSGRVMGDFEQMAWVEVTRVEVIDATPMYTDNALADYAIAQEALSQKKPSVAIRHLEDALRGIWVASSRLSIHLVLARLYEARGDLDGARSHFRGALVNDPGNVEAKESLLWIEQALEQKRAVEGR